MLRNISPTNFNQFNNDNKKGGTSYYNNISVTNNEIIFEEAIERFNMQKVDSKGNV